MTAAGLSVATTHSPITSRSLESMDLIGLAYAIRGILGRSVRNLSDTYFKLEQSAQKNVDRSSDNQIAALRSLKAASIKIAMVGTSLVGAGLQIADKKDQAKIVEWIQGLINPVDGIIGTRQRANELQYGSQSTRNQGSLEKLSANKRALEQDNREIMKSLNDLIISQLKMIQNAPAA
ncbi:MAG: hypothetical protein QRY74_01125 [Chlamydia sp.]